jgi:hypothetical protein
MLGLNHRIKRAGKLNAVCWRSVSIYLSLSLEFLLFPTYSSILHPTIPLSSLKLSPFPIGNCIKSRGSCQDLKLRPNYQLLIFLNTEGKAVFFGLILHPARTGFKYRYLSAHLMFYIPIVQQIFFNILKYSVYHINFSSTNLKNVRSLHFIFLIQNTVFAACSIIFILQNPL